MLRGVEKFVLVNLSLFFFFVVLEAVFSLSPAFRKAIDVVYLFVFSSAFLFFVVPRVFAFFQKDKPSLLQVSFRVGRFYDNINDRLVNALQIFQKHEENREHYSIQLIDAALSKVADELRNEDFNKNLRYQNAFLFGGKALLATILLFSFFWMLFPSSFNQSVYRLYHANRDFSIRPDLAMSVRPGDTAILKGENVDIRAWISDEKVENVKLNLIKFSETESILLTRAADDSFHYTLEEIHDSLRYFVSVKSFKSPIYRIDVIELPLLRKLQAKIVPPAYSRLDPYLLDENVGDINSLKGSSVEITGQANKTIAAGEIRFQSGRSVPLTLKDEQLSGRFRILRDDVYAFHLRDEQGYENKNPINYHIKIIPDQYPFVRIVLPGKDIDLGDEMIIPLVIEAQDDFGVSAMRLAFQVLPQGVGQADSAAFYFQDIDKFNPGDQVTVSLNWDVNNLDLLPKDVLLYYVEVYDNDRVSGPKKAKSKIYRARFPSIYELYEEVAEGQDESLEELKEAYEKTLELKDKIDQLSLEMKRDTEVDWQRQQEIEETIKKQKEIQKQLEQMSEKLDELVQKMEKNSLISSETMQKYQELQKLLQEIMTPELQKTMEKMSEALEKLDPQMIQKAMEDFKLSEEEFKQSIERTISLLKKLKIEQKLDQALKVAQDIQQRQEKIAEQLEKNKSESEELAKEQEKLKENSKKLSDLLKDIKKEMSDVPAMPEEQLEQAISEMDSSALAQKMDQIKEMIQKGDKSGAQQKSSQVQKTLQNVSRQLQQAKDIMTGAAQRRMMQALKQSARELLELSKRQESLMNETKDLPGNSAYSTRIAEQQQDILSGLSRVMNKIFEASKESFYVDNRIGKAMGQASSKMKSAIQSMQNRNNASAAKSQGQAMAALNEAVKGIQGSMQNMMQGGGSGGMSFEQFMQQMEQLASMQQGINEQTMGLGMGSKMSLAQQAAMARLAAEQQQVRKSMQQLAQEAGDLGEILGSLDKIAEDMEKVEKDLSQFNVNRKTIQRQQKILSRMLDAKQSMREREYSKKRKATTAKNYISVDPGGLPTDLGEMKSRLQQDLLRAKKEGYSRDYLELIRKYYETISEIESGKNVE